MDGLNLLSLILPCIQVRCLGFPDDFFCPIQALRLFFCVVQLWRQEFYGEHVIF